MDQETILIVGAGIFGVSTAYHLAQQATDPSRIILLDRAAPPSNNTLAASSDINKIIRADYSNQLYMELGFEAIEAWKSHPFFQDAGVYHQSGWIAMDEKGSDIPRRIRENFRNSSHNHDAALNDMTEDEVRRAWGGVLNRTDCTPFGSYYFNQSAGWADAGKALQIILQEAVKLGIRYESAEAKRIVLSSDGGAVQGVETEAGKVLGADKVVLATGAWTSTLLSSLEDSLHIERAARVEQQVSSAGVCVAHFQLSDEERELYSKLPVFVYGGQGAIYYGVSSMLVMRID